MHRASLIFIYVIPDIQSHLHSIQGSKWSSKTPWRKPWILVGECPLPIYLEIWHFAQSFLNLYIYHSWHPKLARFYSGIKNVPKNSFVDALDTHRKFSYSNSPRSLKFCTELPQCLYMPFLIHILDICWHFLNGACPFGEYCWFKHENASKERKKESKVQTIKCNICGKTLQDKNSFMIHKRKKHEENIETCKLFQKGNCTYHEKCWFSHKNSKIDKMISNEKKLNSKEIS